MVAPAALAFPRLEVHEPSSEDRSRQPFQRLRRALVLLNLVVQRAENAGNGALFVNWWVPDFDAIKVALS